MADTRQHLICTTASEADTRRDAAKVAAAIRADGQYVATSEIFYMPEGTRKASLPAIYLTVSDEPIPEPAKPETTTAAPSVTVTHVADAPIAPTASPDRPMTLAEMDARDRAQAAEERRQAALPPEKQDLVSDADLDALKPMGEPKKRAGRPKGSKNKVAA